MVAVTDRRLVREDFLLRVEKIASRHPRAIILREKDLEVGAYERLARRVQEICERYRVSLYAHSYPGVARKLGLPGCHFPLPLLLGQGERGEMRRGASCHSPEELDSALKAGCDYVVAGHIFDTACKAGTPGRGLDFLRQMCAASRIPVYAIGGITPENFGAVLDAGATGACVMSGMMKDSEWWDG